MPQPERLSYVTLTAIQAGIYICVPAIMAGHLLYKTVGIKGSLIGLFGGSVVLWGLGLIFARLAITRRKVLVEIVQDYFGDRGSQICGIALLLPLISWFSIQLEMMAYAVTEALPKVPLKLVIIFLGLLITLNVVKGLKWVGKLADLSVPLLFLMMSYIFYSIYQPITYFPPSIWSFSGVFLVISFGLVGTIDTPTYYCVSRTAKDAYIAVTLVYLVLLPFMAILGLTIAFYTHTDNFIQAITQQGGPTWRFLVMLFILLAGWTTNNGNLYSAALALTTTLSLSYEKRVGLLGAAGTGLACLGILNSIKEALEIMCLVVGVLGAALVGRFLIDRLNYIPLSSSQKQAYLVIMAIGVLVASVTQTNWIHLSGIGFLDGFLITLFGVWIYEIENRFKWKSHLET